jgi:hypothetical protein
MLNGYLVIATDTVAGLLLRSVLLQVSNPSQCPLEDETKAEDRYSLLWQMILNILIRHSTVI